MNFLFFDKDVTRLTENFNYFTAKPDTVFMAANNIGMLKNACYAADALIIYDHDTADISALPYFNGKVFLVYDIPDTDVHMKIYRLGAIGVKGGIKGEELYKYITRHIQAPKAAKTHSKGRIEDILNRCGVLKHLSGYDYIKTAVGFSLNDRESTTRITKVLYPALSKIFGTSTACIERGIRNAIECSWDHENELYIKIFGSALKKRPTNSHFIKELTEYIENYVEDLDI